MSEVLSLHLLRKSYSWLIFKPVSKPGYLTFKINLFTRVLQIMSYIIGSNLEGMEYVSFQTFPQPKPLKVTSVRNGNEGCIRQAVLTEVPWHNVQHPGYI